MRLGSGPECDWVPGQNEIRTWDNMRLSEMVEMHGEGDSVGYRWHGIVPILSDHAANVAASNTRFIFCNTMTRQGYADVSSVTRLLGYSVCRNTPAPHLSSTMIMHTCLSQTFGFIG